MPFEYLATLAFAAGAVWIKRDALCWTLLIAWAASFAFAGLVKTEMLPIGMIPFGATMIDVAIAIMAIMLWTEHDSQRARIVGAISLVKLIAHFAISVHFGSGDWFFYALLVNVGFIVQCLFAGGWIYGVVDFLNRISPRHPPRRASNHKGQTG